LACALAIAVGAICPTGAAFAAEDDAASRARILRPITLSVGQDLSFGTILPSTTRTSTVRVNLNDTATPGGGALMFGATHGASRTSGQGTLNQIIIITRPTTVWLLGPGPRMRARSWSLGTTTGLRRIATNQYRIIGAGGNFAFRMGATLDIARNQPDGLYQGSFTVTVNYQ
jgi:hypothetical protein